MYIDVYTGTVADVVFAPLPPSLHHTRDANIRGRTPQISPCYLFMHSTMRKHTHARTHGADMTVGLADWRHNM